MSCICDESLIRLEAQCNNSELHDTLHWMPASRLKLNPTKTEVVLFGSSKQLSKISITGIPLVNNDYR